MKKLFISIVLVFFMVGCGYKPSSHMIKNVFDETVYVEVVVDNVEPENAPYVKDEMNRLVYTRFKGRVVGKEEAQSKIKMTYKGTRFRGLVYKKGYITRYRAYIRVKFEMEGKNGKFKKTINAVHEANIVASSLASSTLRTEAIRLGLAKALDEFLGYVSVKGALVEKQYDNNMTRENNLTNVFTEETVEVIDRVQDTNLTREVTAY